MAPYESARLVYALCMPDTAPSVRARRARSRLDPHPSPTSAPLPPPPPHPPPQDLAILTNNLALCTWYRTESQNVKGRGYCQTANAAAEKPWSRATCEAQAGSVWVEVPPFNIPPPDCYAAPETRDNHLGNDRSGNEVTALIKVPFGANGVDPITGARLDDAERCVLRLRYNITTVDTRACSVGATPGTKSPHTTKAACELAGGIWSAAFLTSAYDDSDLDSTPPLPYQDPKVGVGRCSGSTGCPATQNVLRSSDAPGADDTDSILELAVNTNQFGRTFQDRSHVFSIQSRPPAIPENQIIHNLNVAGKRGNIVQTYPATEYRYNPEDLTVGRSDLIHFQWTGNDNTNNNGNNNGEGTNNEDRHNLVQFSSLGLSVPGKTEDFSLQGILDMFDVEKEINPDAAGTTFGGARPLDELKKQFALAKQSGCASSANVNNDQQNDNCQKLNRELPTVDLGLLQMKPGTYRYLSTRNNNFSNRAQKGKITVLETPHQQPPPPLNVSVWAEPGPTAENGRVVVTWQAPGHVNLDGTYRAYVGTDGLQYWGLEREAKLATSYRVQYSEDGGLTWSPTNCMTSCTPGVDCACTIEGLRAGTPIAVQVRSVSQGGLSVPSAMMVTRTLDSTTSRSYFAQLGLEADGKYISTGSTAAIVLGSLSGIFGFGLLIWFVLFGGYERVVHKVRSMKPPPPPPPPPPAGGKFEARNLERPRHF